MLTICYNGIDRDLSSWYTDLFIRRCTMKVCRVCGSAVSLSNVSGRCRSCAAKVLWEGRWGKGMRGRAVAGRRQYSDITLDCFRFNKSLNRMYAMYWEGDETKSVLRSRWIWEQETGEEIPPGYHIHHKNGDTMDDSFSNLELMECGEHHRHHGKVAADKARGKVDITCVVCQKLFSVWPYRLKDGPKYCSQACRYIDRKGKRLNTPGKVKVSCPVCSVEFDVWPYRLKSGKPVHCSVSCGSKARHRR